MSTLPELPIRTDIHTEPQYAAMLCGELYTAVTPILSTVRAECIQLFHLYNERSTTLPAIDRVNLLNRICGLPLFPSGTSNEVLQRQPILEAPFRCDYGVHIRLGEGVRVGPNCAFIDTTFIRIGARTLVGPNVSFFSGGHVLDAELRNGYMGPEFGKNITVGEDCMIGGNVIIVPGITIGKRAIVEPGAVVTKDVKEYTVVAGNPATVVRRLQGAEETVESEGELRRRLDAVEHEISDVRKKLETLLQNEY